MKLHVILIGVLAALLPAACGGGDDKPGLSADVAQAAEKTVGTGSARFVMTAEGAESFDGKGQFAGDRGRFSLSFTAPGGDARMQMEVIFANDKMYMSVDSLGDFLPAGALEYKKWLQVDLESADLAEFSDFAALYSGDPTKILEDLEASGDFEEVGRDEVRGAETRRYRGTVEGAPIEVWIGDDDLLRRIQFVDESTDSETTTVTIELYDFGAEVDVEAPPADEVAKLDELFQGGS
jgi:outer membrane lipoprotein-sorting protein